MNNYHSTKTPSVNVSFSRITIAVVLFIFGMSGKIPAFGQQTKQTSNLYAITGNGLKDTSWIFGTYHWVKSSYLDEVPDVIQAFNKAKAVAVELVLDSSKTAAVASMGLLTNNTLSALLDKPFSDSLDKELKSSLGIGIMQINQLKPINVALTLSMVYLLTDTKSPLQKYSGSMLDGYFAQRGKLVGKRITEFETIEEQMNLLFNGMSDEQQVNQLKYFVRNKTDMIKQGNDLIDYWFKHDLENMYSVSEKSLKVFGDESDFLNKRNTKWMNVLPGLLQKESQFIAVGALHLAGPYGLIKQLQDLGYTLTPVKL